MVNKLKSWKFEQEQAKHKNLSELKMKIGSSERGGEVAEFWEENERNDEPSSLLSDLDWWMLLIGWI